MILRSGVPMFPWQALSSIVRHRASGEKVRENDDIDIKKVNFVIKRLLLMP